MWVAHIEGYAGVMIGIRCARSLGYNWKMNQNKLEKPM